MAITWPTTGADLAKSLKWPTERIAELEDFAAVAVAKIEEKVGPWRGQVITHRVLLRKPATRIVLPWPIDDFPAITVDGTAATETASTVDLDTGIIYGDFPPGSYVITAQARPAASIPPDVALAARKLGVHLAKQELVGPRQPGFSGGPDKDGDVHQGFALPRAVSELIADHVLIGSFA